MLFMCCLAYVTQKSRQPGRVTHDCLAFTTHKRVGNLDVLRHARLPCLRPKAFGERPSAPITRISIQITLRQIRAKEKKLLVLHLVIYL